MICRPTSCLRPRGRAADPGWPSAEPLDRWPQRRRTSSITRNNRKDEKRMMPPISICHPFFGLVLNRTAGYTQPNFCTDASANPRGRVLGRQPQRDRRPLAPSVSIPAELGVSLQPIRSGASFELAQSAADHRVSRPTPARGQKARRLLGSCPRLPMLPSTSGLRAAGLCHEPPRIVDCVPTRASAKTLPAAARLVPPSTSAPQSRPRVGEHHAHARADADLATTSGLCATCPCFGSGFRRDAESPVLVRRPCWGASSTSRSICACA